MTILIENLQNKIAVTDNINALLHRAITFCLNIEGFAMPVEVSILLVDNEGIREINREYRGIDTPTDVLSFPMVDIIEGRIISDEGDFDLDENMLLLGDIVISLEMAKIQSEEYGHSLEREIAFLTTHGVYHLLGFDHENEDDERRMLEKQEAALSQLGLKRG